MPFFSIILPTYNSALTIKKCVDSILSQNYQDFEIVVMDGLSKDNTLDILNSYQDIRIHIISEKDNGVYDAMNKGINKANGEWLYFLGSDDYLYNDNTLCDIHDSIQEEPSCDIIYGDAIFTGKQFRYGGIFTRERLNSQNICHQALFYKKNVFNRLGKYNPEYPIYADWDFNIRCFSTPDLNIKYTPYIIVFYNETSGISYSDNADYKFLNIYRINSPLVIEELQNRIAFFEKSKDMAMGKFILKPFRLLKKWFQ